ncbi:MerR family transcriptional regulator [Paenibacillus swuensis]|uniref:MerR family transcriptional regulator n=1 Tax=Paenibacillus swuensis TaxID=1178515 RepID=A0A172TKX5_9BACL|nr:cobalamin B12-binding domain-containing protein [Paenibacillus swuensis]ANE47467.1 MerR family transcriptional regulator [Paenibacillus swuensis]
MNQRLYTIKEVSLRSGLSTQLIRKWEERYQAVKPERFPNGYRGYTPQHIDTLVWLKQRVDQGVPINLAVTEWQLENAQETESYPKDPVVESGLATTVSTSGLAQSGMRGEVAEYRKTLIRHLVNLDTASASGYFDRLLALHSMEFVLMNILQPVLVEIGELWEMNAISEYQEHFGSHFLRERLLAMKNMYQAEPDAPLIVTACGPRERHELGILFFGFFALQQGYQVVYLGASPSEKGILDCLEQFEPEAFTFSFSTKVLYDEAAPFLKKMDRSITELQLKTKVFIGGRVFTQDEAVNGTDHVYIVSGDGKESVRKVKRMLSLKE